MFPRALLLLWAAPAGAWWSEGNLPMESDFAVYIGKFCFDYATAPNESAQEPVVGTIQAAFAGELEDGANTGEDETAGRLWLFVFSDEKDHWMRARPFWDELSCKERMELSSWAAPVSLEAPLYSANITVGVKQARRPRFWYFAVVNCGATVLKSQPLSFAVHATNSLNGGFQEEFGLDVEGSVFLEAGFAVLFAVVVVAACCLDRRRRAATRGSPLLPLLCASAGCSLLGCLLRGTHHFLFALDGRGAVPFAVLGLFFACMAKALLTILQFIVAKGWAVLYHPNDWPKRLFFLAGLSGVVMLSVGCEIWEQYFHDQSTTFYHYESWPGRSILALHMCLLFSALFIMGRTFAREAHAEVKRFYVSVTLACCIYIVAIPVVCLLAELLDPWVRRKYVERTEISTRFAATALLLVILRPSRLDGLIASRLKNGAEPELLEEEMQETELC